MKRFAILVTTFVVVAGFVVRPSLAVTTWLALNGWVIWIALLAIFAVEMRVTADRNTKVVLTIAALVVAVVCSVYADPPGISATLMVVVTFVALFFASGSQKVHVAEG